MKKQKETLIKFEKINGTESQRKTLYQLLKDREYNISNINIPTTKEHDQFVKNHPYRSWYLVRVNAIYVGSAYVTKNNCIGINVRCDKPIVGEIIEFIFKKHKPLKEIKSLRPPYFYINVAPNNKKLQSQLTKLGAVKIQSTYSLSQTQHINA